MALLDTRRLSRALREIQNGTSKDLSMSQLQVLLAVAQAGKMGVDQGRLCEMADLSPAAVSRTVRVLGKIHYSKEHEGYGLVEIEFDPMDNRKRTVRLTHAGEQVVLQALHRL